MKHVQNISRPPGVASSTIDTITESKVEAKESVVNGKASGI